MIPFIRSADYESRFAANDALFEHLELLQPDYFLSVDTTSMGSVVGDNLRKSLDVCLKKPMR